MFKNKNILIGAVAGFVLVGAGVGLFFYLGGVLPWRQQVSTDDPLDIVDNLYSKSYQQDRGSYRFLSGELRKELKKNKEDTTSVLCHTLPSSIGMRRVYAEGGELQVLVTARGSATSTEQAVVTLHSLRDGWYLDSIECSPGEFAPPREFSFEMNGTLLKNVPEPFNSEYWHLMFDANGELGQYVPLFFDASSTCQSFGGESSACSPDTFNENSNINIKGEMTERGVIVKVLELADN